MGFCLVVPVASESILPLSWKAGLFGDAKSHADFDVSLTAPVESSVDADRGIASAGRVANERRSALTAELRAARETAIGQSAGRLRMDVAEALEAYQASLPHS